MLEFETLDLLHVIAHKKFYRYYKKHNSTYHIKHMMLIHHYCLHNYLSNHKLHPCQYIYHYYIETRTTRMTILLNVKQN